MPQKSTFDWMRQQLNGFMRTQIIGAAATLSLAEFARPAPHRRGDCKLDGPRSRASLQVLARPLMLATRPILTGSLPFANTIGIVAVAAFAGHAYDIPP